MNNDFICYTDIRTFKYLENELCLILVDMFEKWVDTDKEPFLHDAETIKNHMVEEIDRDHLDQLTDEDWECAWEEFYQICSPIPM